MYMDKINVGINGFGRIGKCLFLQLISNELVDVKAININNLLLENLEDYLNFDSIHGTKNYSIKILDDNYIELNNCKIKIFSDKNPENLKWRDEEIDYLFETTGVFLTSEKAKKHDVDYVIMSAPPKDLDVTPIYCYGVNEEKYHGENIVSAASCTTNCIAPMLKFLNKFDIDNCNFITIHSATSSQSVVDTANFKKRTNRSIFNNIIPHTTGASDSLDKILPELKNKVVGTSVRVPVSNVSMIDLNVSFKNKVLKDNLIEKLESIKDDVITNNYQKLVSSDYIGNSTPTILDTNSTFQLTDNSIKFTLWYDNEWSYCSQMIRLLKHMHRQNSKNEISKISTTNCKNKIVFVRCDFNCPVDEENRITNDLRIRSAIKTLKKIIIDLPSKLIIATHFGRPKNNEPKYSTKLFIPLLEKYLANPIIFLKNGLDTEEEEISKNGIYLLENVRFHDYETNNNEWNIKFPVDIYCNEAFSCSHRSHKSIIGVKSDVKTYGYCFTKEIDAFDLITKSKNSKILSIIGGSKIEDKMLMMENLSNKCDYIYITGNNVNNLGKYKEFLDKISKNKAKLLFSTDGFNKIDNKIVYYSELNDENKVLDVGPNSLNNLYNYIIKSDIVFWNGALGVTEDEFFKNGSESLINTLNNCNAKVIIGGGDTSGFVSKYQNNFYHISTGGGASIDYISNGSLPGLSYI